MVVCFLICIKSSTKNIKTNSAKVFVDGDIQCTIQKEGRRVFEILVEMKLYNNNNKKKLN